MIDLIERYSKRYYTITIDSGQSFKKIGRFMTLILPYAVAIGTHREVEIGPCYALHISRHDMNRLEKKMKRHKIVVKSSLIEDLEDTDALGAIRFGAE